MRDEEVIVIPFFFTFLAFALWLGLSYRHKRERLRTIQKAIEAGTLDESTRRSVLDALVADARRAGELWQTVVRHLAQGLRVVLFVGGWITLCIGGGIWVAAATGGWSRYDRGEAMIATFVGFALVSLPLALREMDRRRVPAP